MIELIPDHHNIYFLVDCAFTVRVTHETPSSNFVLNRTFALLNIPSFSETIMNCNDNTRVRKQIKLFCCAHEPYLRIFKMFFQHIPNILSMRHIQRRIDLIQNVQRCRLIL